MQRTIIGLAIALSLPVPVAHAQWSPYSDPRNCWNCGSFGHRYQHSPYGNGRYGYEGYSPSHRYGWESPRTGRYYEPRPRRPMWRGGDEW
jgi:hypothetical protein